MNLAAVIQRREHLTIPNSAEFVALLYDKDRPRDIDAENPCARYSFVDFVGPFGTADGARRWAETCIEAGRVIHPEPATKGKRGRPRRFVQ